jgi:hypothetical protein
MGAEASFSACGDRRLDPLLPRSADQIAQPAPYCAIEQAIVGE